MSVSRAAGFIPGKYIVYVRHFGGHRFVDRRTNLDPMVSTSQAAVTYYTGQSAQVRIVLALSLLCVE